MPYNIRRGAAGCSGYAVVDDNGKLKGCHPTRGAALAHQRALYANVPDASKKYSQDSAIKKSIDAQTFTDEDIAKAERGEDPCWEGYEMVGWKTEGGRKVPNCVPRNRTKKSADDRFKIVENHPKCEGVALVETNGTSVLCYPNREAAQAALDDMDREEPEASVRSSDMDDNFWGGSFK